MGVVPTHDCIHHDLTPVRLPYATVCAPQSYIAAATKAGQWPELPEAPAPSGASQPAFDGTASRPATDTQEAGGQAQARRCVSFPWAGAPQQLTLRAMDLAGRIGTLRDELAYVPASFVAPSPARI